MARSGHINLFNAKFAFISLLAIWFYAFWPAISKFCSAYLQTGYDYQGFLVLPILLLLLQHNSINLKRANFAYNAYGLFCMLLCALVWLLATILEVEIVQQIAILSMLLAIVLTTFGKKITSILSLPLCCLFLLLPVGQNLNSLLNESFNWLLMQSLMLAKQAVYWEANQIVVNNHAYDMQAYLSSLRFVMLYATLGCWVGILRTRKFFTISAIIASFVLMPLFSLWLVLFSYILLNQLYSCNLIVNHLTLCSWLAACIGLIHALILSRFIRDRIDTIPRQDNIDWRNNNFTQRQRIIKPLFIGGGILLLMPLIAQQILQDAYLHRATLLAMPKQIAMWQSSMLDQKKDESRSANFHKSNANVKLVIANAEPQLEKPWKKIKESNKQIQLAQQNLAVRETVFHNRDKYKVLWRVNYVNGHYTTNLTIAKALTHIYNLGNKGARTGIITLSTEANSELSHARDRLKSFLQDFTETEDVQIS